MAAATLECALSVEDDVGFRERRAKLSGLEQKPRIDTGAGGVLTVGAQHRFDDQDAARSKCFGHHREQASLEIVELDDHVVPCRRQRFAGEIDS